MQQQLLCALAWRQVSLLLSHESQQIRLDVEVWRHPDLGIGVSRNVLVEANQYVIVILLLHAE